MDKSNTHKIIVTGASGQVGQSFQKMEKAWPDYEFYFFDSKKLDITNQSQVAAVFDEVKPDVFINCAAYTAVDQAEDSQEKSYDINARALVNIADLCKEKDALLLHYSSDYVYDSITSRPLTESDETTPRGIYAKSKLEGEQNILKSNVRSVIIRTSWVYSEFGNNFVKTMLRLGTERSELKVVNDQIGAPTFASDIANTSMKIIDQIVEGNVEISKPLVLNYSGGGQISWYDFAKFIFESANIDIDLEGIPSSDYPTKAPRPLWSSLDMMQMKLTFGIAPIYWKESVKECIDLLMTKK